MNGSRLKCPVISVSVIDASAAPPSHPLASVCQPDNTHPPLTSSDQMIGSRGLSRKDTLKTVLKDTANIQLDQKADPHYATGRARLRRPYRAIRMNVDSQFGQQMKNDGYKETKMFIGGEAKVRRAA